MKFIVKELGLLEVSYWRESGLENTLNRGKAQVFTWKDLSAGEKLYLKANKRYLRIIPVYKEV